ncbi:class I SAM-dependent RNA methyltransferase [Jannaschia sp. Os4]|uniref:THUMP domain-containing class I SAM-dependent RNA methyltransferase n=1 Tax=Jannaschia sp. Os4 TaxID=2807617 RepID=UPI0019394B9C|nr:class I SAM-dependent RNA methyltransferase [Jannaschia sp. Os4]MBM2576677.1 class I SAM-dependent RNA methyltransferase [Jannaschia sp. Os4]
METVFLVSPPGLEPQLLEEALTLGVPAPKLVHGGVECRGGWEAVRRANLRSRIASRVLARLAVFRAAGFAQLDAGLREIDWRATLRPDVPVRVEGASVRSRLNHGGAVGKRVEAALQQAGLTIGPDGVRIAARLEKDTCTVSVDTSGEALHRRGHKREVNRAPLRETLAAGFLRACGWDGTVPLLDPMCGSGTIPIEAAEIAAGLDPGRSRAFDFERLAPHDADRWAALRAQSPRPVEVAIRGSDRDEGAVAMARANAERAGVDVAFEAAPITAAPALDGPGLLLVNPPYGTRIGGRLQPLYAALGRVARERFAGWQVGVITSEQDLIRATGLNLEGGPVVAHGGLKVRLYRGVA